MAASTGQWTAADIPDLTGIRAVVTGATSGLGLVTAVELATHGADVTLAVRDVERGEQTRAAIETQAGAAGRVHVARLDLADLASVRGFAEAWRGPLHLLVNNAGVMAIPRRETADGFEMQFGTNHLGPFALTGLLLPALVAAGTDDAPARIVTVSSNAHRFGKIMFDDLQGVRRYRRWGAYGQSKLANLLFTLELSRRLTAAGLPVLALAAHPGYASTNLQKVGPQMSGSGIGQRLSRLANSVFAQPAEIGALPQLYAATAADVPPGAFVGPDGFGEQRGHPQLVGRSTAATDQIDATRLWSVSQDLTGVTYPIEDTATT